MERDNSKSLIRNVFETVIGWGLIIGVVIWAIGHFFPDHWSGTYYPDKTNKVTRHIESSVFSSKEECDYWGQGMLGNSADGEFVCGSNCKFDKRLQLYVCDTTDTNGGPDSKDNIP